MGLEPGICGAFVICCLRERGGGGLCGVRRGQATVGIHCSKKFNNPTLTGREQESFVETCSSSCSCSSPPSALTPAVNLTPVVVFFLRTVGELSSRLIGAKLAEYAFAYEVESVRNCEQEYELE